jgi:hypothetical protein
LTRPHVQGAFCRRSSCSLLFLVLGPLPIHAYAASFLSFIPQRQGELKRVESMGMSDPGKETLESRKKANFFPVAPTV